MNYEQKYKEALKVIESLYSVVKHQSSSDALLASQTIEKAFPELKESDDERIRKATIGFLEYYEMLEEADHNSTEGIKECIAWLEKQGERNTENFDTAEKEKNVFVSGQFVECRKSFNEFKELESYWFEYIGDDTYIGRSDNILNKRFHITPQQLFTLFTYQHCPKEETQGEQKTTDKVESKFKVGDWITNGKLLVGQVTSFDGEYYHYMQEGIEQPLHISNAYNWHLWTIEDAEDGDVLIFESFYNSIVLFQGIGINGKGRINYHCKCDLGDYSFGVQGDVACLGTIESAEHYHPATKEQRDLLFQKMKEAGYEWDVEKKELKKIEQKPTEWSEEDEKLYTSALWHIKNSCGNGGKDSGEFEVYNWLKSLKDRVQPKQEWSEEDEHCIELLLPIIDSSSLIPKNRKKCKEFLKSLKPNHWKPSEEQMKHLKSISVGWHPSLDDCRILSSLYNDLLKL